MSVNIQALESRGIRLHRRVADLAGWGDMTEQVAGEIFAAVTAIKGAAASDKLRLLGIENLHQVIDACDVTSLRNLILERLRNRLLAMAVAIGRDLLGWEEDFYVDDYLILRINFPYEVARHADQSAENPGVGRLSEPVRATFRARKVIDSLYDPFGYHRGHPPAAWAHGPHIDTWVGHSQHGRNIWWAIGDVAADAGILIYPELADSVLPRDPRTLGLRAGYPLPKPTFLPLQAGELLVFDPQVLHGTRLNTSGTTRIALTMRIDPGKPTFDPDCFYAHEFWRRATDIERGEDKLFHLRREENLGPASGEENAEPPGAMPVVTGIFDPDSGIVRIPAEGAATVSRRVIVEAGAWRVILFRSDAGLRAFNAECPHYGLDLADGACEGDQLYCPACGVSFDLKTGVSACPSLTLRIYQVWETADAIGIRVEP